MPKTSFTPSEDNMGRIILLPYYVIVFVLRSMDKNGNKNHKKVSVNTTPLVREFFDGSHLSVDYVFNIVKGNYGRTPICSVCGKVLTNFWKHKYCSSKCAGASSDTKNVRRETNLKRYGVSSTTQLDEVKEKMRDTTQRRYGVDHFSKTEEYKTKFKNTNLLRRGVENPFQDEEIKLRIRERNVRNYGVEAYAQSEECKTKMRETNLTKYGCEWFVQTKEFFDRAEETNLKRYGTAHPSQSDCVKAKTSATHRGNYYDTFVKQLSLKNLTLLSTLEEYVDNERTKIEVKCNRCDNVFVCDKMPAQRIFCSKHCGRVTSNKEGELLSFVASLKVGEVVANDRNALDGLELDAYVPDLRVAIEFNGNYWHSSTHRDRTYHLRKTEACRERGIRLIHVFEYEWDAKRDVCESIVSSALGVYDKRIYARRCVVRELSSEEYRTFLNENHLQGAVNSSLRYGLTYDGELVSVIGFGKSRFKRGEMELHRFCSKLRTKVVGGFSKLIKHSNVRDFVSYVDLAHFDGSGYERCGFVTVERTPPSYVYAKNDAILGRMSCQRHKLRKLLEDAFDESLTEEENMISCGYNKIYDCGNLKMRYLSK